MWVELICGLVIYRLVRRFFYDDSDDPLSDFSPSHSTALFSVADRLEKLYRGGKAYVGLRIPDADSGSRQNIDLVLLTKGEAVVISVKNLSGFVSLDPDGTWVCTGSHKTHRIPDPVAEAKTQVAILEAYLEQRGVALPEGFLSCKVVCPNPNFRTITPSYFPSEVVTHEQWIQLKPEQKSILSGWIKGAFRSTKKEMQESIQQNLGFVLSTAPMWDRGSDTRHGFTDHLYDRLIRADIPTFRDDEELERGEPLEQQLEKAIQQSSVSIIVFSKDYASSKWCLDEVVRILEQKKIRGNHYKVLPVYYKVDPSDVRYQRGSYEKAFNEHKEKGRVSSEKIEGWKAALTEAALLVGLVLNDGASRGLVRQLA